MNAPSSPQHRRYRTFAEFYPYYLSEHSNRICTRIHVIGTGLAITLLAVAFALHHWWLAIPALLCGYGFAWIGHFFFEKTVPQPSPTRYGPCWETFACSGKPSPPAANSKTKRRTQSP